MRSLRESVSWTQTTPSAPTTERGWWRFLAACADRDPDLFFPKGSSGPALRQAQHAKAVCAGCPVRIECLEWAQSSGQTYGVWGGFDEEERAAMREAEVEGAATPDYYPEAG
jgi:WhiB family redox-sensing transcriptional regulator